MVLTQDDIRYLEEKKIIYEPFPSGEVIFKTYALPPGRYNTPHADILVILPSGYNDTGPDMFYANPWLMLVPENKHPRCTESPHDFSGIRWQRWSRHEEGGSWRPGIDGIKTVLQRINYALEIAG